MGRCTADSAAQRSVPDAADPSPCRFLSLSSVLFSYRRCRCRCRCRCCAAELALRSTLRTQRRAGDGRVRGPTMPIRGEGSRRSSSALADQFEGSERIQHNGCRPARPLGAIFSSGSATDMFDSGGAACIRTRQSHFSRPQSGSRQKRYCPCCGFWQRVRTCTTSSSHWKAPSSAGCTAVKT